MNVFAAGRPKPSAVGDPHGILMLLFGAWLSSKRNEGVNGCEEEEGALAQTYPNKKRGSKKLSST